jgi:hypothetical protein
MEKMKEKKHRNISGLLLFMAAVGVLIVVLTVLNWVPKVIQPGTMRGYSSVQDVERKLHFKDIMVPSYFPEGYVWPPSTILAQGEPFKAVVMEFKDERSGKTALIISQSDSDYFTPDENIRIVQFKEKASYDLKGRKARIEAGTCKDDTPCSQISWHEGDSRILAVMRGRPLDLIRISESMLH